MIALEKLNKFPPELDDALLDTVLSECMSRGNTTLQQWESLAVGVQSNYSICYSVRGALKSS